MLDNGLLGQFRDVSCSAASLVARGWSSRGRTWQKEEGCREYLLATTHRSSTPRSFLFHTYLHRWLPVLAGFVSSKSPSKFLFVSTRCVSSWIFFYFCARVSTDGIRVLMARVISPIGLPRSVITDVLYRVGT